MTDVKAEADFKKCGAGSAECCIFLVGGPSGAECARGSSLHATLVARAPTMRAKRAPTAEFPDCQVAPPSKKAPA